MRVRARRSPSITYGLITAGMMPSLTSDSANWASDTRSRCRSRHDRRRRRRRVTLHRDHRLGAVVDRVEHQRELRASRGSAVFVIFAARASSS